MRLSLLFFFIYSIGGWVNGQNLADCNANFTSNQLNVNCKHYYLPDQYVLHVVISEWTKGSSEYRYHRKNRRLRKYIKDRGLNLVETKKAKSYFQKKFWGVKYLISKRERTYHIRLHDLDDLVDLMDYLVGLEVLNVDFVRIVYPNKKEILEELQVEAGNAVKKEFAVQGGPCKRKKMDFELLEGRVLTPLHSKAYYSNGHFIHDSTNYYINGIKVGSGITRVQDLYKKPWRDTFKWDELIMEVGAEFRGDWHCLED